MIEAQISEPKKRRPNTELLKLYVSENNETLRTDGKKLYCKICKKSISFETKYLVHRHLKSKKHQKYIPGKISETESKSQEEILSVVGLSNKYLSEATVARKVSVNQQLETKKPKKGKSLKIATCDCTKKYLCNDKKNLPMMEKNQAQLQDFCKTCMKQFSETKRKGRKQNITETLTGCEYNKTIIEMLSAIQPQIKVEIKSKFPTFMCPDCVQNLIVSYEFIEMYQNSDKKLRKVLGNLNEHKQHVDGVDVNKDVNEIEQINIDWSVKVEYEMGNDGPGIDEVSIQMLSENENIILPNHNDDASNDSRTIKNGCFNAAHKKHNSDDDDATKKVFKGFFQPEENAEGSLTCQLCGTVLDGVLPWREHIRQNHLEEKPKRAYNRRTNEPRQKGTRKVTRKFLPNEKGLYQCECCEKSYPKYLFYRRHLRIHAEGTHLCIECGKSFSNITSYNSHMLRHKGEKKFKCSQCPKSFVCPSDLYGHMMTHTNIKPYVCDICGSAFRMPYQLRNHNRVHTGIKNYKCEYCDMRFKSRPNQICHMRTHTGEKPFRCKYCERAFAQSGDCVKHMRQHLGNNNVYQCDLCPLRFPLVRDLRAHFASHKDDDEETRDRNLRARMEEEQQLKIKLG